MERSTISRRRLVAMAGAGALGAAIGTGLKLQPAAAALADQYEMIDLGMTSDVPEIPLSVLDMNAHGVAVGSIRIDDEKNAPWYAENGELVRMKSGKFGARLSCINDSGVIGGRELLGWHTPVQPFGRPTLWIDGEKQTMPYPDGLPSPAEEGIVLDINNSGIAIGTVSIAGGMTFPVRWQDGRAELLELPEGAIGGRVYSIADDGTILGGIDINGTWSSAFWTMFGVEPMELQVPNGYENAQTTFEWNWLDEAGRTLGWFRSRDEQVAFGPAYLPGNGSQVVIISEIEDAESSRLERSDGGSVFAGTAVIGGKDHAAVWSNGVGSLLKDRVANTRGLRMTQVHRILPDGRMAVRAVNKDGALHATLLNPA